MDRGAPTANPNVGPSAESIKGNAESAWDKDTASLYLSILLGSGLVLGLDHASALAWTHDAALLGSLGNLAQLLSLILVSLSSVASAFAVMASTHHNPISSASRFICTVVIMCVYLVEFSLFTDIGLVLFLGASVFVLFMLWDYLKAREGKPKDLTSSHYWSESRNLVTVCWTVIFAAIAVLYFITPFGGWSGVVALLAALGATIFYRVHKEFPRFLKKSKPANVSTPQA